MVCVGCGPVVLVPRCKSGSEKYFEMSTPVERKRGKEVDVDKGAKKPKLEDSPLPSESEQEVYVHVSPKEGDLLSSSASESGQLVPTSIIYSVYGHSHCCVVVYAISVVS